MAVLSHWKAALFALPRLILGVPLGHVRSPLPSKFPPTRPGHFVAVAGWQSNSVPLVFSREYFLRNGPASSFSRDASSDSSGAFLVHFLRCSGARYVRMRGQVVLGRLRIRDSRARNFRPRTAVASGISRRSALVLGANPFGKIALGTKYP